MDEYISRQAAIDAILAIKDYGNSDRANALGLAECAVTTLPSAQPEQIARDIATIIENEKDMRVILKNAEHTETHSCDSERTETHDLVSRQVVIDAVKHHMNNVSGGNDEYYIAHRHIIELLQIVPTAEPESRREWYMHGYRDAQRWIPIKWHDCTDEEREEYGFAEEIVAVFDCDMPNDNQEILVTTSHGYVEKDVCYIDDGYSLDSGYDWIEDIIAWMPLPPSYKEDEDARN